jgi:hypothetical protein
MSIFIGRIEVIRNSRLFKFIDSISQRALQPPPPVLDKSE